VCECRVVVNANRFLEPQRGHFWIGMLCWLAISQLSFQYTSLYRKYARRCVRATHNVLRQGVQRLFARAIPGSVDFLVFLRPIQYHSPVIDLVSSCDDHRDMSPDVQGISLPRRKWQRIGALLCAQMNDQEAGGLATSQQWTVTHTSDLGVFKAAGAPSAVYAG